MAFVSELQSFHSNISTVSKPHKSGMLLRYLQKSYRRGRHKFWELVVGTWSCGWALNLKLFSDGCVKLEW